MTSTLCCLLPGIIWLLAAVAVEHTRPLARKAWWRFRRQLRWWLRRARGSS